MPAAARLGGITRAHLLEEPRYALPDVSSSFHGRDVFAPAAAHLADGVAIEELGRSVDPRRLLALEWPRPEIGPGRLMAQAIYLDTFGNVKLSALADDLAAALPGLRHGEALVLRLGEGAAMRELSLTWARTFGDVAEGAPLLWADSYGRLSLALHQGSAAERFGIELDMVMEIVRPAIATPPAPGPARRPRPQVGSRSQQQPGPAGRSYAPPGGQARG
jgi:S-adenosylmethionine hydrolase